MRYRLARWTTVLGGAMLLALTIASDAVSQKKNDASGDPLPDGALARMGSLRWRHASAINFVAFGPEGKSLVTAAGDNIIRLWDRDTGREIRRFTLAAPDVANARELQVRFALGGGQFARLAVSNDGKLLATVANNTITLWNVENGKEVTRIAPQRVTVLGVHFSPDGKMVAARAGDRSTHLFEIETGKELQQLKAPQPVVFRVGRNLDADGFAISPDGKRLATAEFEVTMQKTNVFVKIADTSTGKEIHQIEMSPTGVSAIVYSPDGKTLAYSSGNAIVLCDADTHKEIRKIDTPGPTATLHFAPNSKLLAARGRDQVVRLFDAETGKKKHELGIAPNFRPGVPGAGFVFVGGPADSPRDLAFSPDGKVLVTGGQQTPRFWNVDTGKEAPLTGGHRGPVSAISITPDGKTMITRGSDNVIRRWNARTGEELGAFAEPAGTVGAVLSPDGKTAAMIISDGNVLLCAVESGKELHRLQASRSGVVGLAFSADSKRLAARGALDYTIRVYDVATGNDVKTITLVKMNKLDADFMKARGFDSVGRGLAFSPDGKSIAAEVGGPQPGVRGQPGPASSSMTLRIWDIASGRETRQIAIPPDRVISNITYSPDGRLIASENTDLSVSLWEIASGRERAIFGYSAPTNPVPPTAFVPVAIGRAPTSLPTSPLVFSPDGSVLVSRGRNVVRVWEIETSREIANLKGHDGVIACAAFAPDGKSFATGSTDTTALVWDLDRVKREPKTLAELKANEVDALWSDLVGSDAIKAGKSLYTLAAAPKQVVPFLSEHVKPAAKPDLQKIDQWIADLDSTSFAKRSKAIEELEKSGELAIPALEKALNSKAPLETRRRIEVLFDKLTSGALNPEQVRLVRAIEVLERAATPESRQLLQALSEGADGALATIHAQAALERIGK